MPKRFERAFAEGAWSEVRLGLNVKLCKSADRREKEQVMFGRFRARIEAALGKLQIRLESAQKKLDRGKVERQLGRLLARNSRAGGLCEIRLEDVPESSSGHRLSWSIRQNVAEWQKLSAGAYLLRTNVNGLTAEELWRKYIQLIEAKEAYRTVKSDLEIRSDWHQTDTSVRAYLLAFLAYVLRKSLQKWMERAGLGSSVRPVLEEIRRLDVGDVILPSSDGRQLRLRCGTTPEAPIRVILQRLGIKPPGRIGSPTWLKPKGEM